MTINMVWEHLGIVLVSVTLTILAGVPIGICAYLFKSVRKLILTTVEVLQTIPALALLGVIMVICGAGKVTVVIGLILYSLLPVVQNTYVGLNEVSPAIKEVAAGMGMTRFYRLIHVEMSIAFPFIFTGIRIAAVTAVGVAVFAAFVGGGGLGSVIYRGIHIQNMKMIMSATAALMVMAVAFDTGMAVIEKQLQRRFSVR